MAYDTDKLHKKAIKEIVKKKLFFIEDVIVILGISSSTFYVHFPRESKEYKEIFDALQLNRVEVKSSMRSKWYKSDNATLQLALMKMISTDEERRSLSLNYQEVRVEGDVNFKVLSIDPLSDSDVDVDVDAGDE